LRKGKEDTIVNHWY